MTERLNSSTTDAAGTAWSPTDETMLQFAVPNGSAVEVIGRVSTSAYWTVIATVRYSDEPFLRVAKIPYLNVRIKGATNSAVKVWSDS